MSLSNTAFLSAEMSAESPAIGIDFGTTNSSIAIKNGVGAPDLVTFPTARGLTESFRSVLFLQQLKHAGPTPLTSFAVPQAIEHYLDPDHGHEQGRLIQSLKSYLPSRTLTGTEVFGRRYTLEDLITRILTDLRLAAEKHLGHPVRRATVGRPVRFCGGETADDDAFAVC